MKSKVFFLQQAGEILVCKHPNSKKLSIKIKPNALPKVVIPTLMTYEMGYRFAVEKEPWIIATKQKLADTHKPKIMTSFETRFHYIRAGLHNKNKVEVKRDGKNIFVNFPDSVNLESEKVQDQIRFFITNILRMEAKKYLPERTRFLAEKYNFSFRQVFVKNLKSRWGSCSAQNNINLNLHLMRLPEQLSDFIILHELCHTIHKNHGVQFHDLLNRLVGNEKALNKELKNYTTIL